MTHRDSQAGWSSDSESPACEDSSGLGQPNTLFTCTKRRRLGEGGVRRGRRYALDDSTQQLSSTSHRDMSPANILVYPHGHSYVQNDASEGKYFIPQKPKQFVDDVL